MTAAVLLAIFALVKAVAAGDLAVITVTQWETIGIWLLTESPEIVGVMKALHDAVNAFVESLIESNDAKIAAIAVQTWMAANGDYAIKEYPGNAEA